MRAVSIQGMVLVMFLVASYCTDVVGASCNVTGVWVNALGSILKLNAEGSKLTGSLHSSVALKPGVGGEQMTGRLIGLLGQGNQPTFTMSISWKEGSVTAWVGQCFPMSDCPVLKTMWLLRSQSIEKDNWKATRIGEDVFYLKKCAGGNFV